MRATATRLLSLLCMTHPTHTPRAYTLAWLAVQHATNSPTHTHTEWGKRDKLHACAKGPSCRRSPPALPRSFVPQLRLVAAAFCLLLITHAKQTDGQRKYHLNFDKMQFDFLWANLLPLLHLQPAQPVQCVFFTPPAVAPPAAVFPFSFFFFFVCVCFACSAVATWHSLIFCASVA